MKRSVHDLSLPGFQIGSHIGDWNLDAPELYPIYKVKRNYFWNGCSYFLLNSTQKFPFELY